MGNNFKKRDLIVPPSVPDIMAKGSASGWVAGERTDESYKKFLSEVQTKAKRFHETTGDFREYKMMLAKSDAPVTEEDVCIINALHRYHRTKNPVGAGEYRNREMGDVRLRSVFSEGMMGDVQKIVPAMSRDQVSDGVKGVVGFLESNYKTMNPVDFTTDSLWKFIMDIHPYYDGNGGTSRTLTGIYLIRRGLPYLSFPEDKDENPTSVEFHRAMEAKDPALFNQSMHGGRPPEHSKHDPYRKRMLRQFVQKFLSERDISSPNLF